MFARMDAQRTKDRTRLLTILDFLCATDAGITRQNQILIATVSNAATALI